MDIIGHQKIADFLGKSLAKNKIAGAYLFSGVRDLGKLSLAKEFAQKITGFSEKDGFNSEIKLIRPETEEKRGLIKKKDIKIDAVRELEKFLSFIPGKEKKRVAIIESAERMTLAAQNALLKTLEEPPKGAVVILVAHDEKKIIPTVKSRCVHKKFWPTKESFKKDNPRELKELSFQLDKIFPLNIAEKINLAESLSRDESKLALILEAWILELREIILGKRVGSQIKKQKAIELIQEAQKSFSVIKDTNSNSRIILENWFFEF